MKALLCRLGRGVFLLLAVVVLTWVFLFALFNDTWVPLHLVWLELPAGRLSWWLLSSFLLGVVLGAVFTLLLRKRRKPALNVPPVKAFSSVDKTDVV